MALKPYLYFSLILFCSNLPAYCQGWAALGTGSNSLNADSWINALYNPPGTNNLYAAGGFKDDSGYRYVAYWNGHNWSEKGTGSNALKANGAILSLCYDNYQNLYAAGSFTDSAGKYYVAKWNGVQWTELGTGLNSLNANGLIEQIASDEYGNIYAGGYFTDSPSAASGQNYVAKWNGTHWIELGTGVHALNPNAYIEQIATDSPDIVYAAGSFYNSMGRSYVAKWNGTDWEELASPTSWLYAYAGSITALHVDKQHNVYAGGWFEDSVGTYFVAKWDGVKWTELGGLGGLNANAGIQAITTDKYGNVYASGEFRSSGKTYVACWNGSSWSSVGMGAYGLNGNDLVSAVCVSDSALIFAAGIFSDGATSADGYKYVAVYNTALAGVYTPQATAPYSAFPNPTNGIIYIVSCDNAIQPYTLYNIFGLVVCSGYIRGKTKIDISPMPVGPYILCSGNYRLLLEKK